MIQQINLYKRSVFEKAIPFSAKVMFLAGVGLLGVLVVIGGAGEWQLRQMERQFLTMQGRKAELQSELAKHQQSAEGGSQLLAQEVARLRAERNHRRLLIGKVEKGPAEKSPGFSPYLVGLARQTVPGLWLRRIALQEGGEIIWLEGSAGRPEKVPRLVQQLSAEPAFSGIEFARLQIERSEKDHRPIDFVLSTQPLEK